MKTTRRILSIVLSVVCMVSLSCITVLADAISATEGDASLQSGNGAAGDDGGDDSLPEAGGGAADAAGADAGTQEASDATEDSAGETGTEGAGTAAVTYDTQPTTTAELRAAIDAYNEAYHAMLSAQGFLAALEVAKPHWQYEVAAGLMPVGYHCELVDWDEDFGAEYYTFFANPMAMAADITVTNEMDLHSALINLSYDTINISNNITLTSPLVINRNVTLAGASGTVVLTVDGNFRHITVTGNATITFKNVELVGRKQSSGDTSRPGGGITTDPGIVVTLRGAVVKNCYHVSSIGGGGIQANGPLTMSDCEISGNSTSIAGGGIYAAGGPLTINNCTMSGNSASGNGGSSNGGAILANAITGTISNSKISGNSAVLGGGGIYAEGNASLSVSLVVNACTIIDNHAGIHGGGGIIVKTGSLEMNGCTISDNYNKVSSSEAGGGVHYEGGNTGHLKITDSKITGNYSGYQSGASNGGGVYTKGGVITITGCTFTNNTGNYGGGMRADSSTHINISGCTFTGNTATGNQGAGLYVASATARVTDCTFTGNNANGGGGAILVNNSDLTITGNSSISDTNGRGIYGYTFNGNSVIAVEGNTVIRGNKAPANPGGGIMGYTTYPATGDTVTINVQGNAKISENEAQYGGGILSYLGSRVFINVSGNAQITNNTALTNGGGIYVNDVTSTRLTVSDSAKITGNSAPNGDGGGIYTAADAAYDNLTIGSAVVFSGNTASAAYIPPSAAMYPNIQFASVSVFNHPLNNYDINYRLGNALKLKW